MNALLIILTGLFGFLATCCGLLLGITFSEKEWERWPRLKRLGSKKPHLLAVTVVSAMLAAISATGAGIYKEEPAKIVIGPGGKPMEKATLAGFEKELEDAASGLRKQAKDHFGAAQEHFERYEYPEAVASYRLSIDSLPTMSAYLNLGLSHYYLSEFHPATIALEKGLQIAQENQNEKYRAVFLLIIGNLQKDQGNWEEALDSLNAALKAYKSLRSPLGEATTFVGIASVDENQGKLEEALHSLETAMKIYRRVDNPLGEAAVLIMIGSVQKDQGELGEALVSLKTALKISRKVDSLFCEAAALGNIGIVEKREGKFNDALDSLNAALKICRRVGNPMGEAAVLVNIGSVHQNQENFEEALDALKEGLDIFRKIGNPIGEAAALANIGIVSAMQRNLEAAILSYNSSLEIFHRVGYPLGEAGVLCNLGIAYALRGQRQEALSFLTQARAMYLKAGAKGRDLQLMEEWIKWLSEEGSKPDSLFPRIA